MEELQQKHQKTYHDIPDKKYFKSRKAAAHTSSQTLSAQLLCLLQSPSVLMATAPRRWHKMGQKTWQAELAHKPSGKLLPFTGVVKPRQGAQQH